MKKILSCFIILYFINTSFAQHQISIHGGWTVSNLQKYGDQVKIQRISAPGAMFATRIYHFPYLAGAYEYDWEAFRFSTGLSFLTLGADNYFIPDEAVASMYLTVPLMVGRKWKLSDKTSLTASLGAEFGVRLMSTATITLASDMIRVRGNINAAGGLELQHKRFKFGAKLHIGLVNYSHWGTNPRVHFRHSGITTYIGYLLWQRPTKKQKQRQLIQQQP